MDNAVNADATERIGEELAAVRAQLEEARATLAAIRNGEVDAVVVEAADGERIYTLKDADRPYRVLIEEMQQGAITVDAAGNMLFANRRLAAMLQQPIENLLGLRFREFIVAEMRPLFDLLLAAGIDGSSRGELLLERKNGKPMPIHIAITELPMDERIAGVLVTDLTEQKRYEEERAKLSAEQAARLAAEKARERLRASEEALKEADRHKDEFLATLAHELRNPLAPIRNALQLLEFTPSADPAAAHARAMMQRQVGQLIRLVDDLLDVSRISSGKIELRKACIDVAEVVHSAVEASRPVIDARGHSLDISLPSEPTWINGDAARLAQTFVNLLDNAAKYTPPGGRIALTVALSAGSALITVKDGGIGIPAAMLPKIFDLFVQVDNSIERAQGGLGIGLTLVKRLVELHGGTIDVNSQGPGQGSEFVVRLPLAEATIVLEKAPRQAAPANIPAPVRRVLVVDDNTDAATSLRMLLEYMGHQVEVAHDGASALERASTQRPDIMFLDIALPEMSGHEIARRLRQDGDFKQTYLIALSGYGTEEDRKRSIEAGFDVHLVKPIEFDKLQQVLRNSSPNA